LKATEGKNASAVRVLRKIKHFIRIYDKYKSKSFLKCFNSIKFLLNRILVLRIRAFTREQSLGIHDVVNNQRFAISNTVSHLEVFRCGRINTAKQKDGLTSFLMLNVLEAKIFQYDFLDGHRP